ncbi:MAG: hypothetical protein GY820_17205 [Gammaproteobacteria bacterium]|nr:hypothetical protein [Gammaproteobacteria bacterium]
MLKIKLENKALVPLHGVKPGATVSVKADRHGVPLEKCWRDRLRDSKIDGAIVVVQDKKTKKKKGGD